MEALPGLYHDDDDDDDDDDNDDDQGLNLPHGITARHLYIRKDYDDDDDRCFTATFVHRKD